MLLQHPHQRNICRRSFLQKRASARGYFCTKPSVKALNGSCKSTLGNRTAVFTCSSTCSSAYAARPSLKSCEISTQPHINPLTSTVAPIIISLFRQHSLLYPYQAGLAINYKVTAASQQPKSSSPLACSHHSSREKPYERTSLLHQINVRCKVPPTPVGYRNK